MLELELDRGNPLDSRLECASSSSDQIDPLTLKHFLVSNRSKVRDHLLRQLVLVSWLSCHRGHSCQVAT